MTEIHSAAFEEQGSTPSNPASGNRKIYPKSDGWYELNSAGTETQLGGGGSMTSFTAAGDSGGGQTIADSNTLTLAGGSGIVTADSATDTVTINNNISAGTIKTISGGQVAVGSDRNLIVASESGTEDNLWELTGLSVGETVYLRADTGDTINVLHNNGSATVKILLYGDRDIILDEDNPIELKLVDTNKLSQVADAGITNNLGDPETVAIVSGQLNPSSYRNVVVAAESGTADTVWEVLNVLVGETIWLTADTGDTITMSHNDGGATVKIMLANDSDVILDEDNPLVLYMVDSTTLAQVIPASGGAPTYQDGTYTPSSNIDNSSTSYADVDGTNIKESVTLSGGETVVAEFYIPRYFQITSGTNTFKLIAGSTDADTLMEATQSVTATTNAAGTWLTGKWTGLGAVTVDIKPQSKVSANSVRIIGNLPITWRVMIYG
jgi:hypothetical protein